MNWLQDLLTNPNSIAHIVALYAFVISGGVLLGKIKIFGMGKSRSSASRWGLLSSCSWESWWDTSDLRVTLPFFPSYKTSD